MTTFLLLLSLILNAGTIFAIILLYLRQNRLVDTEKKQEQILGEIEEVFTSYLIELKEENEQFIELIKNSDPRPASREVDSGTDFKQEFPILSTKDAAPKEQPFPRISAGVSYHRARKAYNQSSGSANAIEMPEAAAASSPPLPESLPDQVADLKNQGKSIEEIARSLNKGKTEIELLLKFRKK